jgi:hypothetical protein
MESVAEEQNNTPRFSNEGRSAVGRSRAVTETESNKGEVREQGRSVPNSGNNGSNGGRGRTPSRRIYETTPEKQDNTGQQQQQQRTQQRNQEIQNTPANTGTRNSGSQESTPRNSTGGGNSRGRR